ncbi:MAG: PAS domain S-box protein, partial [Deltaproteobacteria bacterium]|nr:PAS domain S-box protein [Deltaproteobacteria bacterium]
MTDQGLLKREMDARGLVLGEVQMLQLLWTAVEQAKEAILITSADLDLPGPEILFLNPAFTEMTGYTSDEILRKTPRVLQGPKSDRAMLDELRVNLSQGRGFSGETVNYRKDGSEYFVEWDIAPVRNVDGRIEYFISVQRNVTERKQAEARLAELFRQVEKSRNDLRSVLNELRLGTAMTDEAGRIVFLSESTQSLFGKKEGDALGAHWKEIFPFDAADKEKLQSLLETAAAHRNRIPVHIAIDGGRRFWLEVDVKDDPRDARGKMFFF